MCDVCGQYFCYPSCPSFEGVSAELGKRLFRCSGCGSNLFEADDYTIYKGKPLCEDCSSKVEVK